MFARTRRLTLRPGWPEDAAALTAAIAHEQVVMRITRAPWPYTMANAAEFLGLPADPRDPRFMICVHDGGSPRLVGTIGLRAVGDSHELGYWLTPDAWGRGYATEAGRAVIDIARHALPIRRLTASYFVDNPASGNVLRKLGFSDTGRRESIKSLARATAVEAVLMELDLTEQDHTRLAA
jgi:RimJ/RimL family protein N-acetyltransferase